MKFHVAILTVTLLGTVALADNWPAWRGPSGQGFCEEKNLPTAWSKSQNVKWKIKLENQGNSTPIVWGDRIFLTQANKGGSRRSLLCLDRVKGDLLWKKDIPYEGEERNWNPSWYANASPVTDGERVVISLGSAGMHCFDFKGNELWKRTDLGRWEHQFGNGSSPVLYGDLAILWVGPNAILPAKDGDSSKTDPPATKKKGGDNVRNFLLAVDKKTGKTVWEKDEKHGSWSTPLVVKVNGQDQVLLGNSVDVKGAPDPKTGFLKGYDPKTGDELWHCRGMDSFVYSSSLFGNGVAVGMSGYGGAAIGVKLGGKGDITADRLWKHPKNTQRVGSGMIVGDHVYMVDENGMPRCYELNSGKEVWQVKERPGAGTTWGSMVHANGKLFVLMHRRDSRLRRQSQVPACRHQRPRRRRRNQRIAGHLQWRDLHSNLSPSLVHRRKVASVQELAVGLSQPLAAWMDSSSR